MQNALPQTYLLALLLRQIVTVIANHCDAVAQRSMTLTGTIGLSLVTYLCG